MENKRQNGIISRLLKFITYTEKPQPEEFIIPESYDAENDKTDEEEENGKPSEEDEEKDSNNKNRHEIKKPIPINNLENDAEKKPGKSSKKADMDNISENIKDNADFLKKIFNAPTNKDFVVREFYVSEEYRAFVAYIDGMAKKDTINDFILRPLMTLRIEKKPENPCILGYVHDYILEINQTKKVHDHSDAISEILSGNTILYIDGCDFYISCETKGFDKRGVDKPETEGVVKGPQQGFNESIRTSITLMRRIIKNNSLTTEFIQVGSRSHTLCAVMYIKDLVNPAIVKEVKRRLNNIKIDFIGNAGMLEQLIEDNPNSLIPTTLTTERPDRASSHLFEGKVAILIDGTPFAIVVPVTLHSLLHSPEDAALKWQVASAMRLIRFLAIGIATFLPGLYIAITTFHREMIPTDILIAIAKSKENVPFPSFVEILLMEISFELIREAGIRIPGIIGNTIGIIGALILGQAAVEANIVNPVLIIVIAVTGLGNFAIPNFSLASSVRLLRFPFILIGAFLGFYGIALGVAALVISLAGHKSFGVPYLAPITPKTRRSMDIVLRWPLWVQELRPDYINALDDRRQPRIAREWSTQDPSEGGDDKSNG